MLDYLRNLRKSEEENRQEALNAYLDDALTPEQRQKMDSDLAQDEALRVELAQIHLLKQQMHRLPQRRVRRNFTLDPALYGRPRREPLVQAYPVLRMATVMAAFFFIFALTANLFLNDSAGGMMTSAEPAAMEEASYEAEIAEVPAEAAPPVAEEAAVEESAPVAEEAADLVDIDSEIIEEVEAAPIVVDEAATEGEYVIPTEDVNSLLETVEKEAEAAVQMDGEMAAEEPKLVGPAEDAVPAVMPTMIAEGTAEAALAEELPAEPTAVLTEPATQLDLRSVDESPAREDVSRSVAEIQAEGDERSLLVNSSGLIVLLLGIVFVILIALTLMARRRL